MKPLDGKALFNIFEQGDQEVFEEHGISEVLDNSFVQFGMVIKGVENFYIIDQLYKKRYGEEYERVRESIKLKYLLGLMRYLVRVREIQSDTVHILVDEFGIQSINYALEEMLNFFLEIEYFEQCAILKKYQDLFFKNNR